MTQSSESFVYIKQLVGNHEAKIGAYTIDATGVPLLLGIRTLERLGAILDTRQGFLVLKEVDPTLIIPLKRSPTGHLLLDLCTNWLDGGAKILFQTEIPRSPSEQKLFAVFEPNAVSETFAIFADEELFEGKEVFKVHMPVLPPIYPHSCTFSSLNICTTTHREAAVTRSWELEAQSCKTDVFGVFGVFEEESLKQVSEESVQFQNMQNLRFQKVKVRERQWTRRVSQRIVIKQ